MLEAIHSARLGTGAQDHTHPKADDAPQEDSQKDGARDDPPFRPHPQSEQDDQKEVQDGTRDRDVHPAPPLGEGALLPVGELAPSDANEHVKARHDPRGGVGGQGLPGVRDPLSCLFPAAPRRAPPEDTEVLLS